mgnify:CR=1 FL=1
MDAVRADGISALRAGNARPYEFDRTSGGERRGDHWSPASLQPHFFLAEEEKNRFKKFLYGTQKGPRLAARSSLFR